MEAYYIFLIRASAGIILFYLVYWIFLRKETFYMANRLFLVFALITAILIPMFPLQYSVFTEAHNPETQVFKAISNVFSTMPEADLAGLQARENKIFKILQAIYLTGAGIILIRLIFQSLILLAIIRNNGIKHISGVRIVENGKYGLPFSFFNVVFINPKFHKQAGLPEILAHEKVHIRENHWLDLLFTELLTVIFWFNPFIWMFEHAIKQNHEYLADQGVLAQGHSLARYQALLINQWMGMQVIGITNNLNFALHTNRFKMMTKMKTSRWNGIKFAWTLPAVALLLFAFAEPEYKVKVSETLNPVSGVQKGEKEYIVKGKVVRADDGKPLPGASVVLKGTTIGTVADLEGNFTLNDPNPEVGKDGTLSSELVVSYVGFESEVAKVGASGTALENGRFTFKMKEGVIAINLEDYKNVPPPPPPPPTVKNKQRNDAEETFFVVEELPEYPGGFYDLVKFFEDNQNRLTRDKKIKGKATVGFTVSASGKVTNIKLQKGSDKEAGLAACEMVKNMPDWRPGKQRGKPVPVNYILPVEF